MDQYDIYDILTKFWKFTTHQSDYFDMSEYDKFMDEFGVEFWRRKVLDKFLAIYRDNKI